MDAQTDNPVTLELADRVATLTLNRPERHNSLVPELLYSFCKALETVEEAGDEVGVVVLQANGRSFSTGGDLNGFLDHESSIGDYADKLVGLLNASIVALVDCSKPVVCAVDGQVTGGSIGFVLASDIVVVTERASFTPYYVDVGFSPDGGWTAMLPTIIGRTRAATVQLLNQPIGSQLALEWGIATAYAESRDVDAAIAELCQTLLSKNAASIRRTRAQLWPSDLRERLAREQRSFVEQIQTADAVDGIRAFLEH